MGHRCNAHQQFLPCIYCEMGMAPFSSMDARMMALENRVRLLEEGKKGASSPELDIKQAIAVIRDCGVGDLLLLAPSLEALKKKEPDRPLVLLTRPEFFDLFEGVDYLDAILPIDVWKDAKFYRSYNLCWAVETINVGGKISLEDYKSRHRPDIFADLLGVTDMPRRFFLPVEPAALSVMNGLIKKNPHPIIAIVPTAMSPIRVIPPEYVLPLIEMLLRGYNGTMILLGKTEPWNANLATIVKPNVINLLNKLSLKEMIAACSLMDAMIVPDTGALHIAGALGVKCLAVLANNIADNSVGFYQTVKALGLNKGELPCAPCGDITANCLTPGTVGAPCMRLLTPERIITAFNKFYQSINIAFVRDISLSRIGGAELTDAWLIKKGKELGYNIRIFDQFADSESLQQIGDCDLAILSNLWLFDKKSLDIVVQAIQKIPYIKLEHDYRSLEPLAQGKFKREDYAEKIFKNSVCNIFVSPRQCEDYYKEMKIEGLCAFPMIDLNLFEASNGIKRKPNSALVATPIKASKEELSRYKGEHNNLHFESLDKEVPHHKMAEIYSQYEYLIHLPQERWSCERIIFEAALCGCKVVTNDKVGGISWEANLTNPQELRTWLQKHENDFWNIVAEKTQ